MPVTLQFDFRKGGAPRRRDGAARVLLLGDFSGRAHRGLAEPGSIGERRLAVVDVDNLDTTLKQLAPRVQATLPDGSAVDLAFDSIDAWHPDRLVRAFGPLLAPLALRRRLLDPAQSAAAAAELGAVAARRASGTAASAAASAEDDAAMFSRLLGGATTRPGGATWAASTVDRLLRQIIGSGDVTPAFEAPSLYVSAVESTASAQLRALLHLPAFQAVEAAWRGAQFLVSRLDLDEDLQLCLLDVTLDELRSDAAGAGDDAVQSALARRLQKLAAEAADAEASWLVAAGLFEFGVGDLDLLASIGRAALAAGIPFVAGADASITGTVVDGTDWLPPADAALARWRALRGSGVAAAIGLVAPRLLLRLPYGKASDPIDAFPFEELAGSAPAPGELLWGGGAIAAVLALARDPREGGVLDVDDLPALTYTADGERRLQPCAEWLASERVVAALTSHGLMPLVASRHRNAVRLAGWASIAAAKAPGNL